jgi:hypothetical protein
MQRLQGTLPNITYKFNSNVISIFNAINKHNIVRFMRRTPYLVAGTILLFLFFGSTSYPMLLQNLESCLRPRKVFFIFFGELCLGRTI